MKDNFNDELLNMIPCEYHPSYSPYTTKDGRIVPRVTEVLSFIDMGSLLSWANFIGFKHQRYSDIMKEASDIGTLTHSTIEKFLKGEELSEGDQKVIPFNAFKFWWDGITSNNKVVILGQEQKLVCDYFGGTYDLLLSINDKPYLVDFKTSNHVGYKYFMQLAAYRYMLALNGISISGCLILQLSKTAPDRFEEFFLNFDIPEDNAFINDCTQAFFSLINTFYQVNNVKDNFSKRYPNT